MMLSMVAILILFLSTLSLRRATPPVRDIIQWEGIFLSTLSLRRATRAANCQQRSHQISIHALLAESDYLTNYHFTGIFIFLSTLSLRRATCARLRACLGCFYFYPRSPCGERLMISLLVSTSC